MSGNKSGGLLFAMGMALPALISRYRGVLRKTAFAGLPLGLGLLAATYYLTISHFAFFENNQVPSALISISCIPLTCAYMLALRSSKVMPVRRFVSFMGALSLSLYLFHLPYYGMLDRFGFAPRGQITFASVLFTLITFPIFLLLCMRLDQVATWTARSLENLAGTAMNRFVQPLENSVGGIVGEEEG